MDEYPVQCFIECGCLLLLDLYNLPHCLKGARVGKFADMIMIAEDPLKDITALKRVGWVMKGGDVIGQYPEWRRRPIQDPQETH